MPEQQEERSAVEGTDTVKQAAIEVAPAETFFKVLDGRVKTLLCLAAIVIAAVLRHWFLAAGLALIAAILLCRQRYSLKMLCWRLVIPFGVAWLVLVSFLLTYGHTEIGCITIWRLAFPLYREGLEQGFVITLRLLAAVCIITLLSVTTPMPEIMATMRMIKVPGLIVDLAEMIYRYITLINESVRTMRRAQVSRGGDSLPWYRQAYDLGLVAGVMMIKALDRSTNIYKAMLSRGFDENSAAPPYYEHAVARRDLSIFIWGLTALLAWLAIDLIVR
jgi:cobalt/nickel transport system permease protein